MKTQEKILNFLEKNGAQKAGDIADFLAISRAMTHRHLKEMEEDNSIEKQGNPPHVSYKKFSRKKILFLATGGTFASATTQDGLSPHFSADNILELFPEVTEIADLDAVQICNLDSTNLHPEIWTKISTYIWQEKDNYDGFVVGHGTDTISYSASALSFALQGLYKPVVLTGSVLPPEKTGSDAKQNFLASVRTAASTMVKEICVCFHQEIIKGTRVRKVTNEATKVTHEGMGVYSSINLHLIGNVEMGRVMGNTVYFSGPVQKQKLAKLLPKFSADVALVKIFPGMGSDILRYYSDKKAIVIEGFGPGNIPFDYENWLEEIKNLTTKGVGVFIATQNPFGEVDMEIYEVGKKAKNAGASSCRDMITETALTKLMWIFGNFPDFSLEEVQEKFLENLVGEVS